MILSDMIPSLGFLGAGNMATAILGAVASKGLIEPGNIAATDVFAEKPKVLAKKFGTSACGSPKELLAACKTIVLAVKPQDLPTLLESIAGSATREHLFISICAGVRTEKIEAALDKGSDAPRVVRVMPNTPALIGQGAAGVAGGAHATPQDIQATVALFEAVGIAAEVKEADLDAITALSGSGPAYVFKFIETIQAAGEAMGLDAELARRFTIQTFVGAANLAAESDDSPAELRAKVTSKGGTTAAALDKFAEGELERVIGDGVKSARERSIELAE